MMEDTDIRSMRVAEKVIDRLASEAHDAGMLIRAWHGPRQSRLYVYRWAGGSEPVSAGYVDVERTCRWGKRVESPPPSTPLQVAWYARTAHDRQTMVDLAARAQDMLAEPS